ncbi:putative PEP-binding protein [Nocardioides pantholopis]|uniref:putative PEP-binding protein n=1 Tax=Nocardioides pantholopis TaxID=2483798 RepID=UPI0019D0B1BD|nr:putative PEP-binding protein [Nocardioides pantholopis]
MTDTTASPSVLTGIPVVPGVARGPVLLAGSSGRAEVSAEALAAYGDGGHRDVPAALAAYDAAAAGVAADLSGRAERATGAAAEVLRAGAVLATDPALREAVRARLRAGAPVLPSVSGAVGELAEALTARGGPTAERVADLRDIERRVVARLVGAPEPAAPRPSGPVVLVADDLAPSDATGLDPDLVVGLVLERGGPTGHTAIVARQLGIACLVGVAGATRIPAGTPVLLDATAGVVLVAPGEDEQRRADSGRPAAAAWTGPGRTADGTPVPLLASVSDAASAARAAREPVEGVGLFRTELCLAGHRVEPTVAEQAVMYAEVLGPFRGRRVVVRTLDAAPDKPVPYPPGAEHVDPALGVRGLRRSLVDPGPLERQLDAVAAAAARTGTEPWVLAPMVATVAEAAWFATAVRRRGLSPGVMVEVPAAALLADRMLEVVDFLSIGTNDLAQYAMAADRNAPDLAHLCDPWQPAVLRLVAMATAAGRRAGKPVGVCGEAAADPLLACVLVGLGATSLSLAAPAARSVGARLAAVDRDACASAAAVALTAADPAAARAAAARALDTAAGSS